MMGKASFRKSRLLVGLRQAAFATDQLPCTCRTAAFVYHNFLSEAECNHLVKLGTQRVRQMSDASSMPPAEGYAGMMQRCEV